MDNQTGTPGPLNIDGRVTAKDTRELPGDLALDEFSTTVQAAQMTVAFRVETTDGIQFGLPGDYLAIGTDGAAWPVAEHEFELLFQRTLTGASA